MHQLKQSAKVREASAVMTLLTMTSPTKVDSGDLLGSNTRRLQSRSDRTPTILSCRRTTRNPVRRIDGPQFAWLGRKDPPQGAIGENFFRASNGSVHGYLYLVPVGQLCHAAQWTLLAPIGANQFSHFKVSRYSLCFVRSSAARVLLPRKRPLIAARAWHIVPEDRFVCQRSSRVI